MCIFDLTTYNHSLHYFVNNPHILMSTIQTAVIEQIQRKIAEKQIPVTWLLSKVGVRQGGRTKKRSLAKYELVKAIELRLHAFIDIDLHNMTTKEVLGVINGEADNKLLEAVTGIPLKVDVEPKTTEELTTQFNEVVAKLEVVQLWKLLDMVTTYEEVTEKKEVKATTPKTKPNYISIPKEEATVILGEYYNSLASEASITTPECFRGGRTSNPTQHLQRLLYSYHNQDCKQPNSITESVFTWHKGTDKKMTVEEAQRTIDTYIASHPEHLEEVNALASKSCVKALVTNAAKAANQE